MRTVEQHNIKTICGSESEDSALNIESLTKTICQKYFCVVKLLNK